MQYSTTQTLFSCVIRGKIGPYEKFTPLWLFENDLIKKSEALGSKIEVISNAISSFSIPWASIKMIEDTFQFSTENIENIELARELILNWINLTEDPPLHALGLNYMYEMRFESEASWHKVGHTLAPKEIWGRFGEGAGLLTLTIQKEREDPRGVIRVDVNSAGSNEANDFRIRFSINHHYNIEDKPLHETINIIKNYTIRNVETSRSIIDEMLSRVLS